MQRKKYYQPPHQTTFSRLGKIITFTGILLIKLIFIQLEKGKKMKTQKKLLASLFLLFLFPFFIIAQDINVHNMIGKTQNDVINKYGKPVHRDKSNPAMDCMFYKTKNKRLTFVADQDGVFQAEANASYSNEKQARNALNEFITGSISTSFIVDTVSTEDFTLNKEGVNVELQLCENKMTKKYEIRVKAHRTGG